MKKKCCIIGTVGVPANYGGWETLVEYLIDHLNEKIDLTVYCSKKNNKHELSNYKNTNLKYLNLKANGYQSIFYDGLSLFKSINKYDVILVLGVSGGIFFPLIKLLNYRSNIIINVDGNESKRDKWNFFIKNFLKISEFLAIKYSNQVIADNLEIKKEIDNKYLIDSYFIPYGGIPITDNLDRVNFNFSNKKYAFTVCRIEPENNINLILDAFANYGDFNYVIVGNWNNSNFGKYLKKKYKSFSNIEMIDPIYNLEKLNFIRGHCSIYIHGHRVGGTNPSLVEAMWLKLPIFAFNVKYNISTTFGKALYFKNSNGLIELLKSTSVARLKEISSEMFKIANKHYRWSKITNDYYKIING